MRFRGYLIGKSLGINNNNNNSNNLNPPINENSMLDLLDWIIKNIQKETEKKAHIYEKQPFKLIHLNSIIQFSVKIFTLNNMNSENYSEKLNDIFSVLFLNLMVFC